MRVNRKSAVLGSWRPRVAVHLRIALVLALMSLAVVACTAASAQTPTLSY
jgi:hypothetical protein